jgi:hypothetical protein
VVDLVRQDLLIEIQTRGFSMIKRKLAALLALGHRVRIVHSIPMDRWIEKVADDGAVLSRRRSPRHASLPDVFDELVAIADLLQHPRLELDLLVTKEEELRRHSPGQAWRRRGWIVVERRLLEVVDSFELRDLKGLAALLPDRLPEFFTTADLAHRLGRSRRLAQRMAFCLRKAGVVEPAGKRGNAIVYRVLPLP